MRKQYSKEMIREAIRRFSKMLLEQDDLDKMEWSKEDSEALQELVDQEIYGRKFCENQIQRFIEKCFIAPYDPAWDPGERKPHVRVQAKIMSSKSARIGLCLVIDAYAKPGSEASNTEGGFFREYYVKEFLKYINNMLKSTDSLGSFQFSTSNLPKKLEHAQKNVANAPRFADLGDGKKLWKHWQITFLSDEATEVD